MIGFCSGLFILIVLALWMPQLESLVIVEILCINHIQMQRARRSSSSAHPSGRAMQVRPDHRMLRRAWPGLQCPLGKYYLLKHNYIAVPPDPLPSNADAPETTRSSASSSSSGFCSGSLAVSFNDQDCISPHRTLHYWTGAFIRFTHIPKANSSHNILQTGANIINLCMYVIFAAKNDLKPFPSITILSIHFAYAIISTICKNYRKK